MNVEFMRAMGFGKQVDLVQQGKCPSCEQEVKPSEFRDDSSMKEYKISGVCQKCQDEVFGYIPKD